MKKHSCRRVLIAATVNHPAIYCEQKVSWYKDSDGSRRYETFCKEHLDKIEKEEGIEDDSL